MPPDSNDVLSPDNANVVNQLKESTAATPVKSSTNTSIKILRSLTTLFTHLFIGIIVGVSICYGFRNGLPLSATDLHVVLCVIGYQFLMAEAILALAPDSWTSTLSTRHKRWVHTWLQVCGAVLGIVGSCVKIIDKPVNFNTVHGKSALAAVVFTLASLINGLTSLYAYELRKFIPSILSKLTHICFGVIAVVMASVTLAYGFNKYGFRSYITDSFADSLIVITGIYTTIVIMNPLLTFFAKFRGVIKS